MTQNYFSAAPRSAIDVVLKSEDDKVVLRLNGESIPQRTNVIIHEGYSYVFYRWNPTYTEAWFVETQAFDTKDIKTVNL